MPSIKSDTPMTICATEFWQPPAWALLERHLIDSMKVKVALEPGCGIRLRYFQITINRRTTKLCVTAIKKAINQKH